jgi:diguanylate cyclase (GGDEF)-like protein
LNKLADKELDDLFSLTRKFSSDILSLDNNSDIWWHLANNIISKFGFEDLVVYEINKSKILIQVAAFGNKNSGNKTILNPIEIPFNQGVVGKCASSMKPILVEKTKDNDDYLVDDENRMSELSIPIIVDGKLYGVIYSEHPQENFYNENHLKTLSVIADTCGTKISQINAVSALKSIVKENRYKNKVQKALMIISETVYESDTIIDFYKSLHECISRLTFAKNFFVAHLDEEENRIEFSYYVDELDNIERTNTSIFTSETPNLIEYVLKKSKPKPTLIYEEDINKMLKSGKISIQGQTPKAWIGIPFGNGINKGIVVVQSYTSNFIFNENERQLLSFIAKHIYNAMERKEASERLTFLALHDSLTKLPNRALFQDKIESNILKINNNRIDGITILCIDLDLFKEINDTYGHKIGDKVLIQSSLIIKGCLRESDTLARLGGDEFAILMKGNITEEASERIARSIVLAFKEPIKIDSFSINSSVSLGVAISHGGTNETSESLMVKADNAMYQSKLKGRGQYTIHKICSDEHQFPASRIEYDFLEAFKNDDLFCVYQPLIDFKTNTIFSAEVLIRWQHKTIGLIPPDQFIPILEKSGLIMELDMYILKNSVEKFIELKDSLHENFKLNINISTAGFASDRFISYFKELAIKYPAVRNRICVEITEESLVGNVDAVKKHISILNNLGILVALDDFGTGYSSLNYLDQFEFDYLKIDKTFVDNVDKSKKKKIILLSIINLAKSLGIKITVEGIETKNQFNLLKEMGCDLGQGYFISRPSGEEVLTNTRLDFLDLL